MLVRGTGWMTGFFVAINLTAAGYFLDVVLRAMAPGRDVVSLVETHLLFVFVALAVLRCVLDQPPAVVVQPLLILPVRRSSILGLYAFSVLVKRINVVPLLPAFAFWLKNLAPLLPARASLSWFCGLLCVHLVFIALNIPVQWFAADMRRWVIPAFLGVAVTVCGDGPALVESGSRALGLVFSHLRHGDGAALLGCCAAAALVPLATAPLLSRSMNIDSH